ncbi:UNVERIFIED_CONTAM: hypothetical protein HDU68_002922 [Siphonaria sp. JEL0065]|nr:hypothetical protein HDU68_002922 [Siphonaria sp. JEL0065]
MYAYNQYRHESKKWFSRVYLLFVNVLLLAIAVVVMVAGYSVLKVVTDNETQFLSDNVIHLSKGTGIGLLTVGAIIASISLVGSIGACRRHNGALKFYIFGMIIFFLVILVLGIKFIIELKGNANRWNDMTVSDWRLLDDYHKDMYQTTFTCCGFNDNKATIYGGRVLFDAFGRDKNFCTAPSYLKDALNCQDGGNAWYHVYLVATWTTFIALIIFLVTGIGAADQSKLRSVDVGYQVVATQQGYEMLAKA